LTNKKYYIKFFNNIEKDKIENSSVKSILLKLCNIVYMCKLSNIKVKAFWLAHLLCLTVLSVFCEVICFADDGKIVAKVGGLDLFIKALEYQGDNPSLIHSIYVEYMLTEQRPTKSKEFLEKERQKLIESAKIGIPNDSVREKYIAYIPTRLKEQYSGERKSKGSYLLKGSRNSKDSKIRFVLSQFQSASADWSQPSIAVRGVTNGKAEDSILSDVETIIVSSTSFYSQDFQNFGRIAGYHLFLRQHRLSPVLLLSVLFFLTKVFLILKVTVKR
jgi:hypothetical protein